jgi:phytanoyl-CoA hydroxylase
MKEHFEKNGFALISGFLNQKEISSLNLAINRVLSYTGDPNTPKETHFYRGSRIVFQNDVLHRIVWAQGLEANFSLASRLKEIKTIINSLLNIPADSPLDQIINQLHLKAPNDGVSFHFHQDAENRSYGTPLWKDVLQNGSFIQTVLALGPLNEENGTLRFLPGSHKEGYIDLPNSPDKLNQMKNKYGEVTIECEAGDLVLFHPFCIHGSDTNKSQEIRKVFINGFCPPKANRKHYPGCGVGKRI